MAFLVWILLLHSAVQATGPETRTTTLPTAAFEPPARPEAAARTTTDLLTFIRALEAPRGYDDYERRIPLAPPKPLTTMTLDEVLDWQVRVRRSGAPSTAAGGYQIIHPTLKRLVSVYELSRDLRFDAGLQDRLARLLIAECGTRPGAAAIRAHARFGNCLAGIWAALPLTRGPNKGLSAHHGVAGNRALTRPETVLALLAGQPVAIPAPDSRQPPGPARDPVRTAPSGRPLAFGALPITDVNAAMRAAQQNNTLTPSLRPPPATRTWKVDPYASR